MADIGSSAYVPTWTQFGWTPWGLGGKEETKPTKQEMFPTDPGKFEYVSTSCIEDFLQHNEVFKNGIRNTPCHMDSYMTVVDFKALDAALAILIEEYHPTVEEWGLIATSWSAAPNTQKPARIVASELKSLFLKTHETRN